MKTYQQGRYAAERLDILEDSIPREDCAVKGCTRHAARYEWAGAFGTRWLCWECRARYREHDHVLALIRNL
jgi:hypothetical protein